MNLADEKTGLGPYICFTGTVNSISEIIIIPGNGLEKVANMGITLPEFTSGLERRHVKIDLHKAH